MGIRVADYGSVAVKLIRGRVGMANIDVYLDYI